MIPDNVSYLVLDSETTGVEEDDKVVEIGWFEIDEEFNILNRYESLIDPQRMIAPAASAVHGLTLEELKDSPTIEEYFSVDDPSCYGKKITDPWFSSDTGSASTTGSSSHTSRTWCRSCAHFGGAEGCIRLPTIINWAR